MTSQSVGREQALEAHLAARCGELFAGENDVLLYDVTSAAQRRSKLSQIFLEKSGDEGFPTHVLRCV
jgi:hypothetical protein